MRYRDLLAAIQKMPEERLDDTVTVHDPYDDEYTAIVHTDEAMADQCDALDEGHLILMMKA